jgi:hypothetical protein
MVPLRKFLFAALLCTSAFALAPAAHATGLSTTPGVDGAMLIPTYSTGAAHIIPVQYYHRHHHYWHRRHWHRHYR